MSISETVLPVRLKCQLNEYLPMIELNSLKRLNCIEMDDLRLKSKTLQTEKVYVRYCKKLKC